MWSERFNKEFKEESKKETNEKSKNELKKELFGEEFYEEMEPEKRLEIFQKNIESDNNKELRECLWTARYGKRKPKKEDNKDRLRQLKITRDYCVVGIPRSQFAIQKFDLAYSSYLIQSSLQKCDQNPWQAKRKPVAENCRNAAKDDT
jgi:hypothetical protein